MVSPKLSADMSATSEAVSEQPVPRQGAHPSGDQLVEMAESIFADTTFAVLLLDANLRCRAINKLAAHLLEVDADILFGQDLSAAGDQSLAEGIREACRRSLENGASKGLDLIDQDRTGDRRVSSGSVIPLNDKAGAVSGYVVLLQVMTSSDHLVEFMTHRDPFVSSLLDAAADAVVISDSTSLIRSANRATTSIFGYSEAELLGASLSVLMPEPFASQHEKYLSAYFATGRRKIIGIGREVLGKRKDGSIFPMQLSVGEAQMNGNKVFVGIIRDLSERQAAEERATYLERHDPLTGVLTRSAYLEECETELDRVWTSNEKTLYALFTFDVDQFSDVNEAYGFHVGDSALKGMVQRISKMMPKRAWICRIAADEFSVMAEVDSADHARQLANEVHQAITDATRVERQWLRLRVSVGGAVQGENVQTFEELTAKAKLALQAVQHHGGNAVRFYTPEMAQAATRRMMLTMRLGSAAEQNQLHLVYQPIVCAKTGRMVSAEALVRWTHDVLGPVSPAEFIPVAEESGQIFALTDWVLREAIRQMAEWYADGFMPERVFVNISGQQFLRGDLVERLDQLLSPHPQLYRRLGLEITEQAAVHDMQAVIATLTELAERGIETAIDDFGSGYSSLSYVQKLPVLKLKIDKCFVDDVPSDIRNAALVRAAIGMAHGLGLRTVAEGVERREQQEFLLSAGCDQMQGYYFGRPMPAREFVTHVRDHLMGAVQKTA